MYPGARLIFSDRLLWFQTGEETVVIVQYWEDFGDPPFEAGDGGGGDGLCLLVFYFLVVVAAASVIVSAHAIHPQYTPMGPDGP